MDKEEETKDGVKKIGGKDGSTAVLESIHQLEMQQQQQHQGPPSLGYKLTRSRRIAIAWQMSLIAGINTFAPTLIFYLYKHLAGNYERNPALTYTWVTLALGTLELFQWPYRSYHLYRDNFARSGRPLDSSIKRRGWQRIRPYFTHQDFFGMHFLLCIVIGAIGLTLCCSLGGTRGSFPLLVISIPTVVFYLGLILTITSLATALQWKTPFQMSSLPAHQPFRPGVYFIMEDIVAVDGNGGYEYRKRINTRYLTSPPFRQLMQHLTILFAFWSLVLFLVALAIVVVNVQSGFDEDIVYGIVVGFSVAWSALVTLIAWYYAQWSLQKEKTWWTTHGEQEQVQKDNLAL